MEQQTYKIKKGEITFNKEAIIIKDKEKKYSLFLKVNSALWIFYGIISVLRYQKTGDEFLLWSGLLIGIGHLILFFLFLFRSTKDKIQRDEIVGIHLKQKLGDKFLEIKLKGNKKRIVYHIDSVYYELNDYIKANFNDNQLSSED